jgi:hypothetical protein
LGVVAAIAGVVLGCSSGSTSSSFASYWADGDELCAAQAACGGDEATCLAGWPTAAETTAALDEGDVPDASIAACAAASRLLDKCSLRLSCEEANDVNACATQDTAFETDCALVLSAMSFYYMTHPHSVYVGPFHGSYDGASSGTFTGHVSADGNVTASILTSAGPVDATGSVFISGKVAISASVDGVPMNLEGTLFGRTNAFTGTGTWTAALDTGDWMLASD